ncbi:MAG: hypothetical protein MUF62_13305 [Chitinophagaceae bacterium]|nr:hypothetical protein [Chitinophagaceae bacterium]
MKKSILLLFSFISLATAQAQPKQSRWHPFAGLYVSGDAALAHIGPSPQVGVDYRFSSRLSLSTYAQYFGSTYRSTGSFGSSSARYRSFIVASLLDVNFYRRPNRGFAMAFGPAFHTSTETYTGPGDNTPWRRSYVTAAGRFGYAIPVAKQFISIELNIIGPWSSKVGQAPFFSQSIDILSQLSLGGRWVF